MAGFCLRSNHLAILCQLISRLHQEFLLLSKLLPSSSFGVCASRHVTHGPLSSSFGCCPVVVS